MCEASDPMKGMTRSHVLVRSEKKAGNPQISMGEIKAENKDRISELSDDILRHIFSYLPMRLIVQTSILSRRWMNLWTGVPNLELQSVVPHQSRSKEFVNMIGRFLQRHKGELQRFQFHYHLGYEYSSHAEEWIRSVSMKGVKELDLDFSIETKEDLGDVDLFKCNLMELPYCIFVCESMLALKLKFCYFNISGYYNPFSSRYFRLLQTLSLVNVLIQPFLMESLISDCPFLESLELIRCNGITFLNVSPPLDYRLQNLNVAHCSDLVAMHILVPSLLSLQYHGKFGAFVFKNMSHFLNFTRNSSKLGSRHIHGEVELSHLKILTLPANIFMALHSQELYLARVNPPVLFPKLEELHLHEQSEWKFALEDLTYYLGTYPDLRELSIQFGPLFAETFWPDWWEPHDSKFFSLKTVKIKGFIGKENVIWLVKYFLEKAIVLESLILVGASKSSNDVCEQLELLPRASSFAKITLQETDSYLCSV